MFAQRRNRPTTHFSEHIPIVKRRISVCAYTPAGVGYTCTCMITHVHAHIHTPHQVKLFFKSFMYRFISSFVS